MKRTILVGASALALSSPAAAQVVINASSWVPPAALSSGCTESYRA